MNYRYNKFSKYLRDRYGEKVWKLSLDAGFTCPNKDPETGSGGCIFCRNDSFSQMLSEQQVCVNEQIRQGIELGDKVGIHKYIVYFQSSTNTFAPVSELEKLFFEAISFFGIVGISIATRPDCLSKGVLDLFEKLAEKVDVWIELGLQSSFNKTLKAINRGHTFEDYLKAVDKLKPLNVRICTHIMVGLPEEELEHSIITAERIAQTGTHDIKIHPLLILKDTELESLYLEGKILPLDIDTYALHVSEMLQHLPPDMVIQRLTAEAPREIILAPRWVINKTNVINTIHYEMQKQGMKQGEKYELQF